MSISEGDAVGFQSRRRAPGAAESGASMRDGRGMYVFFGCCSAAVRVRRGEREMGEAAAVMGLTELTRCVQ